MRLDHLLSKEQKFVLFKIGNEEIYYHAHCLVLSVLKKYTQGVEIGPLTTLIYGLIAQMVRAHA